MPIRRLRLTASCASLLAMLPCAALRAAEPVVEPAPGSVPQAPAAMAQVSGSSARSTSYWYRIPRRAVELTQSVYAVSADRLMLLGTSTSLERLRDCEASHGVSLMTLWQFRGSTLSFQAGRNGEPTLRWSSRSMHRDEATRGLFDALVYREPEAARDVPAWQVARN